GVARAGDRGLRGPGRPRRRDRPGLGRGLLPARAREPAAGTLPGHRLEHAVGPRADAGAGRRPATARPTAEAAHRRRHPGGPAVGVAAPPALAEGPTI